MDRAQYFYANPLLHKAISNTNISVQNLEHIQPSQLKKSHHIYIQTNHTFLTCRSSLSTPHLLRLLFEEQSLNNHPRSNEDFTKFPSLLFIEPCTQKQSSYHNSMVCVSTTTKHTKPQPRPQPHQSKNPKRVANSGNHAFAKQSQPSAEKWISTKIMVVFVPYRTWILGKIHLAVV
jgi:hypothetical protein